MERNSHAFSSFPLAVAALLDAGFDNLSGVEPHAALAGQMKPSPDQVADLAYRIWEAEGRPHGRDRAHWLAAEERFRALAGEIRTIRECTVW